jgi:hypothetical protein
MEMRTEMRRATDNLEGQKVIVLVFACLAGISTVAAAVVPALS